MSQQQHNSSGKAPLIYIKAASSCSHLLRVIRGAEACRCHCCCAQPRGDPCSSLLSPLPQRFSSGVYICTEAALYTMGNRGQGAHTRNINILAPMWEQVISYSLGNRVEKAKNSPQSCPHLYQHRRSYRPNPKFSSSLSTAVVQATRSTPLFTLSTFPHSPSHTSAHCCCRTREIQPLRPQAS